MIQLLEDRTLLTAPVAYDGSASTLHDQPAFGTLFAEDMDFDPLTFHQSGGPSNGTVQIDPTGGFNYTPNAQFVGSDSFTWYATAGGETSNTATVSITVTNNAPTGFDQSQTTPHDQPLFGTVFADDLDGDPLTYYPGMGPIYGDLEFHPDGTYTFTPAVGFTGSVNFSWYASDGIDDSNVATVFIDVTNGVPVAYDQSEYTVHDQSIFSSVFADDLDGDPLTYYLNAGPANGTLYTTSGTPLAPNDAFDGGFQYVPVNGFVGGDSFQWHASDGLDDSNIATVFIDVTNEAPVANDDFYTLVSDPVTDPVLLSVTSNDVDPDGDPVTIVNLTSTVEGASVSVAASGTDVIYQMPAFPGTDISIGGVVILDDMPTSTEDPGTDGGEFQDFQDSFSYTIADNAGAADSATVQVAVQKQPNWKATLLPAYNEAAEVGVDGTPGYDLKIRQTFGEKATGLKAAPKTQTWQKNVQTAKFIYVDKTGNVKAEAAMNRILADTNNVQAGARTPLKITDRLSVALPAKADKTAVILETVDKKLGFNKLGATLPTPAAQPWDVQKQAHKDLLDQMNPRFGTLTLQTKYVYVDKPLLESLHTTKKISDAIFNDIKNTLKTNYGLDYATLPDKYEQYSAGNLGTWKSSP